MTEFILHQIYFDNLLLFIFSSILILSALAIITVQNSIYSVLFLVLNFVTASGLLFLLECEFLSLLFIIVYVGAIAVLFLFVVMMLDVKILETSKDIFKYLPAGGFIGGLFILEISLLIGDSFFNNPYVYDNIGNEFTNNYINFYYKLDFFTDINVLGQILYTYYIVQFLIAGLLLLLAVIGAVVLTMNNNSQKTKKQMFFKQISRSYKNVLLI
jgi:NADH-quinone oxidoreductase subunit J